MIDLLSIISFLFDNSLLYMFYLTMFEKKKARLNFIGSFLLLSYPMLYSGLFPALYSVMFPIGHRYYGHH